MGDSCSDFILFNATINGSCFNKKTHNPPDPKTNVIITFILQSVFVCFVGLVLGSFPYLLACASVLLSSEVVS